MDLNISIDSNGISTLLHFNQAITFSKYIFRYQFCDKKKKVYDKNIKSTVCIKTLAILQFNIKFNVKTLKISKFLSGGIHNLLVIKIE